MSESMGGIISERQGDFIGIRTDTEPGLEKWLSLNAEYAKIWPNITIKKAPPPDSKEWEGKPDKLQYFSSNPGAGD
jgi:ferredoxin